MTFSISGLNGKEGNKNGNVMCLLDIVTLAVVASLVIRLLSVIATRLFKHKDPNLLLFPFLANHNSSTFITTTFVFIYST